MADDPMAHPDPDPDEMKMPLFADDLEQLHPLSDILASIGYDADDVYHLVVRYLFEDPRGVALRLDRKR